MDFRNAIQESCLSPCLKGETKAAIIPEMIDMLDAAGKLPDRDAALAAVWQREAKMSTGMRVGVALPHGKTDTVPALATAVALKPEGIDFGTLDGKPARIFVMTISPLSDTGSHIQYLAEIGKLLTLPSLFEGLLAATTKQEMRNILLRF